jgi:cytochrome c-type biogenesis protein
MSWAETLAQQLSTGAFGSTQLLVAFAGGLLAGFGPCVLPMMPAVFGYITGSVASAGSSSADSPAKTADARAGYARGLLMAAAFVLGMSAVFTVIGAVAGLLGRAILVGGWAYYLVAAICVVLGLHLLGVVRLPFDRLGLRGITEPRRASFFGALSLGILFGVVASPCSTPVLAVIATLAAAGKSPAGGALLLFVYGLGKGVPLLLIGVASGTVPAMRSLSRFTPALTKLGGAGLLVSAAYLTFQA